MRTAEEIVDAIRQLPAEDRRRVIELVLRELTGTQPGQAPDTSVSLLGLFADEPALADAIAHEAMLARERDPLRGGHA